MQHELLTSQKNELFQIIQEMGLYPTDFQWTKVASRYTPERSAQALVFRDTRFRFEMDRTLADCDIIRCSPGKTQHTDVDGVGSWTEHARGFRQWLQRLRRETEALDLWEQLSQSQLGPGVSADPEGGNGAFTVAEAKQITAGVEAMREYLATECAEEDGAQEAINEKLDYLVGAANRQGRMDWVHTCLGALTSLGITLTLTPEHGTKLMALLKGAVSGVVKLLT